MTPPAAVLDRPDAPETTEVPATPAPSLFLYRIVNPSAEPPIPTRQEVLRAMYDEGVVHDDAVAVYGLFQELSEMFEHYRSGDSETIRLFKEVFGKNSPHAVAVMLSDKDPRHTALEYVMRDDVLPEDSTAAHRLLERHFGIGERHRLVHSFTKECIVAITRR